MDTHKRECDPERVCRKLTATHTYLCLCSFRHSKAQKDVCGMPFSMLQERAQHLIRALAGPPTLSSLKLFAAA